MPKQSNLQPKAAAMAPRSAEYFSGTVSPTFLFKPAKTDSDRCVPVTFYLCSDSVLVEFLLRSGLSHSIAYDSRKHVYKDSRRRLTLRQAQQLRTMALGKRSL
jgi:hypothetical protein